MSRVCQKLGLSRSGYYKARLKHIEAGLSNSVIEELVMEQRRKMPRIGGRKLYWLIRDDLKAHGIRLGRDRFFDWLRDNQLLVRPKKRYTRTTHSHHRFRIHTNQVKGMKVKRPDQVWVSDITYIRLRKAFCYLALITDAFSRKIIGYHVNDTLELSGCLKALQMACRSKHKLSVIHHSDRGIQYCSNRYIEALSKQNIKVSMAEAGNCYENALAERVNGILKNEFNLDATFDNINTVRSATRQAIDTYNNQRPHMSLNMKTPQQVYAA